MGAASHQPHTPRGRCEATPSQVGIACRPPAPDARSRSSAERFGCGRAPHSLKTPAQPENGVHCSVPSGPRDARAAAHTHAAYFVRSCLPYCDHSCPTPTAHTLALRWLCAGRIIQGGNHRERNRGATTHHHSAETKRARSLTPQPRIPRGVRVEHCTGGKRSPHRPLVATLDGSFTPRRDGSALERRL